jgi:hypothetical protein
MAGSASMFCVSLRDHGWKGLTTARWEADSVAVIEGILVLPTQPASLGNTLQSQGWKRVSQDTRQVWLGIDSLPRANQLHFPLKCCSQGL